MSADDVSFDKSNLDLILRELAKEFRKRNGARMPAEIVLIGGAAILANYGFRDMTYDIDALIVASSAMKEAINRVGDRFGLPNGWMNTDFIQTKSYSPKLLEHSVYYRTFSNVVTVRTVTGEYLIAMKLMSGRKYRNDLSDVIGILMSHEQSGTPVTLEAIQKAFTELYGSWEALPANSAAFITQVFDKENFAEMYQEIRKEETQNRKIALEFRREHPQDATEQGIDEILKIATEKMKQGTTQPDQDEKFPDIRIK